MNFIILDNVSKNNWIKIILVIVCILIFVFVLIGLIGALIKKIFIHQGKQVDKDMGKLVTSRVCDNSKDFKKFAQIKSMKRFFKVSQFPIILLFLGLITYIIYGCMYHVWNQSLLNRETGIASLFYTFDFAPFFEKRPNIEWDAIIVYAPSPFKDERIFNYFIALFTFSGTIIYLIDVAAYIARKYRMNKMAKKIYSANLDNMDLSSFYNVGNLKNVPTDENGNIIQEKNLNNNQ